MAANLLLIEDVESLQDAHGREEAPFGDSGGVIVMGCGKTCPTCGNPCINTFNHQDGEHSCGDHSW